MASWIAPAVATFVERLPELTVKGQKLQWLIGWLCGVRLSANAIPAELHRSKGHKVVLAPCDVCWEATRVVDLDADGKACRMTPNCPGRHRRDGLPQSKPEEAA